VHVYVFSRHEFSLLSGPNISFSRLLHRYYLSGNLLPHSSSLDSRPYEFLYLGRPTGQKGWDKYLEFVFSHQDQEYSFAAILPFQPPLSPGELIPDSIDVFILPDDDTKVSILSRSKCLFLPSNYESFGIAQIEAASMYVLVPILGYWPLWIGYESKLNSMMYPLDVVYNELKIAVNNQEIFMHHLSCQSTYLNNLRN